MIIESKVKVENKPVRTITVLAEFTLSEYDVSTMIAYINDNLTDPMLESYPDVITIKRKVTEEDFYNNTEFRDAVLRHTLNFNRNASDTLETFESIFDVGERMDNLAKELNSVLTVE